MRVDNVFTVSHDGGGRDVNASTRSGNVVRGRWRRTCDPWSGGVIVTLRGRIKLPETSSLSSSPFKLGSHRSDKIDAQDGARHKYSDKSNRWDKKCSLYVREN